MNTFSEISLLVWVCSVTTFANLSRAFGFQVSGVGCLAVNIPGHIKRDSSAFQGQKVLVCTVTMFANLSRAFRFLRDAGVTMYGAVLALVVRQ